jgi:LmbE family N-acetylglucosaminyl deacetylase
MKILAVGAHPDDIEFGCYGTLSHYADLKDYVHFVLFSSGEKLEKIEIREKEAFESAEKIGAEIDFLRFPDTEIKVSSQTIDTFRKLINKIKPDTLFVHHPDDNHQDHKATTQICLSSSDSFDKILFYEGPATHKFSPVIYFKIDNHFEKKINALKIFKSQKMRPYLDIESIRGLARYRAYQCGLYGHLCEAFSCYKWIEKNEWIENEF